MVLDLLIDFLQPFLTYRSWLPIHFGHILLYLTALAYYLELVDLKNEKLKAGGKRVLVTVLLVVKYRLFVVFALDL